MDFVLAHLPHIVAPIVGLGFLARFGLYVKRLPPAHLNDEELAAWQAEHGRKQPG
jgi:hypothetical protein